MGGLATAVRVIVDSVHSPTGWTSAWFALVLAIALTLVAEFAIGQWSSTRPRVARVVLALVNGCLVFTMALGGNHARSSSGLTYARESENSLRFTASRNGRLSSTRDVAP